MTAPAFAKEARDLIDRHADYAADERGMYFIEREKFASIIAGLLKDRAEGHESGRLAGRAEAAEIARRFEYTKPRSRLPQDIADAILSASTAPDPPAEESDRG